MLCTSYYLALNSLFIAQLNTTSNDTNPEEQRNQLDYKVSGHKNLTNLTNSSAERESTILNILKYYI